jgi:vacuolar-type H+-ATPase subunit I/STV1
MIRVPHGKPHVPPPITPKEAAKEAEKTGKEKGQPAKAAPAKPGIGRGPEMDARSIAVRLAALATEAKEKEIGAEEFEKILEEVIKLTGLKDPQAAMEEANRKLQKEIELMMEKIKANKELMDEAESWQKFGELLSQMNAEQVEAFIGLLQNEIRAL